jgi:hypothetical protein
VTPARTADEPQRIQVRKGVDASKTKAPEIVNINLSCYLPAFKLRFMKDEALCKVECYEGQGNSEGY